MINRLPYWRSRWTWVCGCGWENWRWSRRCLAYRIGACDQVRPPRNV